MDHGHKRRKTGHSYSNVHANDHARIHLGDVYEGHTNNFFGAGEVTEKAEAILESLKSKWDNMDGRRENLSEPARDTFQWLFTPYSTFDHWLRVSHDEDLFWVTGKPGSGKSTLMKFVTESESTVESLQAWGGSDKVLTAHHFFWHPGTAEQKTISGLLRNLLYQLCRADLDLMRVVFEPRWERSKQHWAKIWTVQELWESLYRLRSASRTKVCLFIDALDESQPQDRHTELCKKLLDFCTIPNVKVCVSSRPWQVFQGSFERLNLNFKMDIMIGRDTNVFAFHQFLAAKAVTADDDSILECQLEQLADSVSSRAEGVFLWVRLIVDALCQHIVTGATHEQLSAQLLEFPAELEDFYRKMIYDRVHSTWRVLCAAFLRLALLLYKDRAKRIRSMDWRAYWAVQRIYKESITDSVGQRPHQVLTALQLRQRRLTIEKTLNAACGGFLTMFSQDCTRGPRYKVDFAHTSMVSFLETPHMHDLLAQHAPSYIQGEDPLALIWLEICKIGPSEADLTDNTCNDLHQMIWESFLSVGLKPPPAKFDTQLERSAIFFHEHFCVPQTKHFHHDCELEDSDNDVVLIMKGLMLWNHFQYARRAIRSWPGILAFQSLANRALDLALSPADRIEYDFIELLFEHGADIRCCTFAWIGLVSKWATSYTAPALDHSMWSIAKLLIQHGACLTSQVPLEQYSQAPEVQVVLAACVPEEKLEELYALLEDVSSPETRARIGARVTEIRQTLWPKTLAWQDKTAVETIDTKDIPTFRSV